MRKLVKCIAATFLILGVSVGAKAMDPTIHSFTKTLSLLPGQGPTCDAVLSNTHFRVKFTYFLIPNILLGVGTAVVKDPASTGQNTPIYAELDQDGDSDRYGFTHYFISPGVPMIAGDKHIALKGIILNVCLDHSTQAGVLINIPLPPPTSQASCVMATDVWNYCR